MILSKRTKSTRKKLAKMTITKTKELKRITKKKANETSPPSAAENVCADMIPAAGRNP